MNRYFYPTTPVHPESVLVHHPSSRDATYYDVVTDCETEKNKQSQFIQVKQVKCQRTGCPYEYGTLLRIYDKKKELYVAQAGFFSRVRSILASV